MENVTAAQVKDALERVIASFQTVLYEDDEQFLENMKTKNLEFRLYCMRMMSSF